MSFSTEDREKAMIACGRACCICHKFCGVKMEPHHIEPEAVSHNNTYDNLIPLCFDCHADAGHYNDQHPKGIKYKPSELRKHRDDWYKKVSESSAFAATDYIELDKATYIELAKFLPKKQFEFLRDESFGNARFKGDFFEPLEIFDRYKRLDPLLEYLDADLEKAKSNLANSITNFRIVYLPVVFYSDLNPKDEYMRIPSDLYCGEPDGDDLRDAKVKEVDDAATKVWERYCEYIQICRRKLKV